MSQAIILFIISTVSWIVITGIALQGTEIEHPGENRGISVFPYLLMIILVFGIGSIINFFYSWVGTWIMFGLHLVYIIYGFMSVLVLRNKSKNKPNK